MRCKRHPRFTFTDTSRKRAALRRKQANERDALPLLAQIVSEAQPTEDEVMTARAVMWDKTQRQGRAIRASRWREARAKLDALPASERAALRHAWDCAPYPGDPVFLLMFLHSYAVGRFTLTTIPFPLVARDPYGIRIEPFVPDSPSPRSTFNQEAAIHA